MGEEIRAFLSSRGRGDVTTIHDHLVARAKEEGRRRPTKPQVRRYLTALKACHLIEAVEETDVGLEFPLKTWALVPRNMQSSRWHNPYSVYR